MTDHGNSTVPELSIVIASVYSRADIVQLLESIRTQRKSRHIEVIVAHGSVEGLSQNLEGQYAEVIFLRFPPKSTLPLLWGAGISRSRGKVIAILDTRTILDEQWIDATLISHEGSDPIVGGAVESTPREKWLDWAAYFCEYGQFMHPLTEGAATELPGNNLSFKRWVLSRGREFIEPAFWKTHWCRQLQREGVQLVAKPSIVVYDKKSYHPGPFLVRRFHHGRCFAGMRGKRVSLCLRGAFLMGSPLLPVLLLGRTIRAVAGKRRYVKEFIFALPFSLLAILCWSLGEFCGYLAGPGKSCQLISQ
jgi:glycosyltransferase involved in cell wall biosynthesis